MISLISLLAVAFHTGHAQNLAPADAEAHVVENFLGAEDMLGHMLHGQHRLAQSILFPCRSPSQYPGPPSCGKCPPR